MDVERELRPFRNLIYAIALFTTCAVAILVAPANESPYMHTFFDAGIVVVSSVVAMLLWDMGWRADDNLTRLIAVAIGINAVFEFIHVLPALEISRDAVDAARLAGLLRPVTWPPAAHILPIGLCAAYALRRQRAYSRPALAIGLLILGSVLLLIFDPIPPYSAPTWLGITRPSLVLVPFLSFAVGVFYWHLRGSERLGSVIVMLTALAVISNIAMLYSEAPADRASMLAHAARFANGLFFLFTVTQMGSIDTARRMRVEQVLTRVNEALEDRVRERTTDLQEANAALRSEAATRELAELKTLDQLSRLRLLQQTTHAIAERQDLASIFQVVVGSLEDHLNVDFACLCQYDQVERELTVARIGAGSSKRAAEIGLGEQAKIEIDDHGLGCCIRGEQVYEPDIAAAAASSFAQRLGSCGLRSFVAVPLLIEQRRGVFGVLLVARMKADGFSSSDREFLNQLGENVALASNQAQLHFALRNAYEELRDTQQAVMQQERLRALGQMASGIAHDINNAISPATLYVDSILARAPGLDERTRGQLETVQRAIGDVAQTVSRMGEFYRQGESRATLAPVNINVILGQVPDLTKARWSDLALARGASIEMRVEAAADAPTIMANESELREALINLVFNAADALPDGGRITLRVRRQAPASRFAKPAVTVEVSDDGVGMDENTRNHCLEPFFTTKGERGTGLGLAMVYGIAQRHGAELQVDSEPGKGTTIRLIFADAGGTVAERKRDLPPKAQGLRLLLIDDDPLILLSLRNALEYEGHQVTCAQGGQAGIDMFSAARDRDTPFSAVITDLGMPHLDGRQVAAAIKKIERTAKVIMLTGWGQLMSDGSDVPDHVDKVLSKPPNMWELREALTQPVEA